MEEEDDGVGDGDGGDGGDGDDVGDGNDVGEGDVVDGDGGDATLLYHPLQSLIKIHFDLSTFNIYQLYLSIFCYQ